MPQVFSIIQNAAFAPDAITTMGQAFDDAWEVIKPEYLSYREEEINLARAVLARAVVTMAGLGNTDRGVLKDRAMRVVQIQSGA